MIRSNIKSVIRSLQLFEAGIPGAIERSVSPKRWILPLKNATRLALRSVAYPEEEGLIPYFVETVMGAVFENGVRWTLNPREADVVPQVNLAKDLMDAGFGRRGRRVPFEQGMSESRQMETVRQGILDWVKEEKDRDPVDDKGLSDLELAQRIEWIIGVHPGSRAGSRTAVMDAAGQGLARAVQEYLDAQASHRGTLSPMRIRVWLEAVLVVWREKLSEELPVVVKQEMRKLWEDSGDRLI